MAAGDEPLNFKQVVSCVLVNWPALRIAVENSFGGSFSKEKGDWLVAVLADFLQHTPHVNKGDLEDYLGDLMDQEFDTLIEDGSLESVAEQLYGLWEKFNQRRSDEVQDYVALSLKRKNDSILYGLLPYQTRSSSECVAMETNTAISEEVSSGGNEEDANDAWTVVGEKSNKTKTKS